MGCSASLAKLILFVFNIVLFILGFASVGVGLWVRFSRNTLFEFVNLLDAKVNPNDNRDQIEAIANQNGLIAIAAIVLIVVGAVTLVVGFCGCCGSIKESTMLLNIYAFLIAVVLIIQIVAAVLAIVFQNQIKNTAEKGFKNLQSKFYVSLNDYVTKNSTAKAGVTYFINWLQVSLGCCGSMNTTAGDSWFASNRTWAGKELENPVTCCQLKSEEAKAAVQKPEFNWMQINEQLKDPNCPYTQNSASLHQQTCPASIESFISKYAVPLIVVGILFALIQLLGIVFACCLVNALRNA